MRTLLAVGADDLDDALQSAIDHAAVTAGVEHSVVALATRDQIEVLATLGSNREAYEARVARAMKGDANSAHHFAFLAGCFVHGNVIRVPSVADLPDSARAERESFQMDGVQSVLALPIRSETAVIGIQLFESVSTQRDWSDDEIEELQHIAEMIGLAIERRGAEQALRVSEERFRALTEHATGLTAEFDASGNYSYISPNVRDLLGYEPEELLGKSAGHLVHPDDIGASSARLEGAFKAESESHVIHRLQHRDGSWRWFDNTGRAFRNRRGDIRFVSVGRDISDRRRVEEEFARRVSLEAHLASLSRRFLDVRPEESGDAIRLALKQTGELVGADRGFIISYLPHEGKNFEPFEWGAKVGNGAFDQLPWATPRILAGQVLHIPNVSELPPEASVERERYASFGTKSLVGVPLLSGGKLLAYLSFERTSSTAPFTEDQINALGVIGQIFVSTLRRRRWQERLSDSNAQLAQSQKIEAVGRLAGGIAHDFNNLLTVILGFARPLREDIHDYGAQRDVDQIIQAAERAAALTGQLLSFSRRQTVDSRQVDLNTVVSGIEVMLGRLVEEDVRLSFELCGEPCDVVGDPHQLEQVLVNLAVNARDALPDGGDLTVRTKVESVDDVSCAVLGLESPGEYVVLEVADTGTGMSEEACDQSLEPFYTTKKQGKGTGLGLSIAYGIVRQAHGAITIESKPMSGTTVRIHLPRTAHQAPAVADVAARKPEPGSGRVLLVEDERAVRNLLRRLLEQSGYEVIEASDGMDAIARFHEAGSVDALVTDVVMPRMGGFQLARELRAENSALPILYVSGYPKSESSSEEAETPKGAFVVKPFSAERLLRSLAEILEQARAAQAK